jgi:formylglycine-generating enzyme required for sulfatase activity
LKTKQEKLQVANCKFPIANWGVRIAMIVGMCIAAGCGSDPSKPSPGGDANTQILPVLEPKSGGTMVLVPAGSFTMGDANGRPDETPHQVSVNSFYIDKLPVTQELFERVMGFNPSRRKGKTNPVEKVQWTHAAQFCNKCSELEGLTPCYNLDTWNCNFEADGYRLPTEAEWEYACRAGNQTKYSFGDTETDLPGYAWCKANSGGATHPVGQLRPNFWGLYDMHGNVWQWCNDYYAEKSYSESPKENPRGPKTGKMRMLRGGAWDCDAEKCRAAYRHKEFPVYSDACFGADSYGFRRARRAGEERPESQKSADVASAASHSPAPTAAAKQAETKKLETTPAAPSAASQLNKEKLRGTIIFVSDRSGLLKIWKMPASGKEPKQLTHDANPDADPRFSPDGKKILYTSLRGGFPEIWMMDNDGLEQKFVTKGSQGCWSPDGKSILFIRDNQTFVRDLASANEKRVTPESWERCGVPAWSPDGKHVAVASRHLGNIGIFVLSLDGKTQTQLKAEEPCCTPEWSKNGKKILCQTVQGHIHQIDVNDANWEQMTFGADVQHDARYSPDGAMIVFCRAPTPEGPWQICVKEIEGDDLDFLQLTKEGSNSLPDWHADE